MGERVQLYLVAVNIVYAKLKVTFFFTRIIVVSFHKSTGHSGSGRFMPRIRKASCSNLGRDRFKYVEKVEIVPLPYAS